MKTRWAVACIIIVAASIVYSLIPSGPRVGEIVQRAFNYRLKDEPQIVARKISVPFAIHGPGYIEDTTLRLSPTDYHELVGRLLADPTFEKKRKFKGEGFYYERFVVGKERVSWWADDSSREFSFSYAK